MRNACNDLCREKCACGSRVCTAWVRNPQKSSVQVRLGPSHQELLFHQDAFHQLLDFKPNLQEKLLSFPWLAFPSILDGATVWESKCSECRLTAKNHFQLWDSHVSHLSFSGSRSSRHLFLFDSVHADNSLRSLMMFWTTFHRASLNIFWMVSKMIQPSVSFSLFWRSTVRYVDCSDEV